MPRQHRSKFQPAPTPELNSLRSSARAVSNERSARDHVRLSQYPLAASETQREPRSAGLADKISDDTLDATAARVSDWRAGSRQLHPRLCGASPRQHSLSARATAEVRARCDGHGVGLVQFAARLRTGYERLRSVAFVASMFAETILLGTISLGHPRSRQLHHSARLCWVAARTHWSLRSSSVTRSRVWLVIASCVLAGSCGSKRTSVTREVGSETLRYSRLSSR